jgi:hypothetical protein
MSSAPLHAFPPALPIEQRRTRRIEVLLPVEVEIQDERRVARITDLSRAGARISLRGTKSIGDYLIIRRNGIELGAQIAWCDSSTAGVWFPKSMDESSFLQIRKRTIG